MNIDVVGVGGTGGWFLPALLRTPLPEKSSVTLYDPDTVEAKNLARQNFRRIDVSRPKVDVFVKQFPGITGVQARWPADATASGDFIFCFADNHQCRLDVLDQVDSRPDTRAIITGNEFASADAYYYEHGWRDTVLDPRIRHPEMTLPEHMIARSCAAAPIAEQSVLANQMAAVLAQALFKYWASPDERKRPYYPVSFYWGGTRIHTKSSFDLQQAENAASATPPEITEGVV